MTTGIRIDHRATRPEQVVMTVLHGHVNCGSVVVEENIAQGIQALFHEKDIWLPEFYMSLIMLHFKRTAWEDGDEHRMQVILDAHVEPPADMHLRMLWAFRNMTQTWIDVPKVEKIVPVAGRPIRGRCKQAETIQKHVPRLVEREKPNERHHIKTLPRTVQRREIAYKVV